MLERWIDDKRLSSIVLDQTSDNVLVTNADISSPEGPKILFANRSLCELTGYTREELVGLTPRIFQGKDTDRRTLDRIRSSLLADHQVIAELLNYTKDGTPYWIEMRISPLYNEDGEVVSFVSVQRNTTARKTAEIEKERAARLTALGEETAKVGTWAMDLESDQVYWSSGMFKIFERDQALGPPPNLDVLAWIAEAHQTKISDLMKRVVKTGVAFETEAQCDTGRGELRWLRLRGEAIVGENGRTRMVVGATRDITTERETRERLEAAISTNNEISRDFATAREIAKVGVFDYSVRRDLQHWSKELFEMTGLEEASFPASADQFVSGIDKKDRPSFDRLCKDAIENGTPYQTRVLFHRPDGADMHMQIVADVKDIDGDRRIVGIARDVTEEIEASVLLRSQEERFRLIASSVGDVLWDIDVENADWWFTPQWPEKLGIHVDAPDISPDQWIRFVCEDERDRIKASLVAALRSSSDVWTEHARVVGEDGSTANVQVNATMLRREDNRVYRALGNLRNIDREIELNELLARTRGLESLSKMTGGLAHDFNNLLMIVLGNTELLEMAALEADDREAVELISKAATSASDLTRRLLQFSGTSHLNKKVIDLREFLAGLMPLLKSSLTSSVAVSSSIPDDLWPIEIDSTALEQSILNFAINARDAMPSGGNLSIRCENKIVSDQMLGRQISLSPGSYVCISVSDDGEGMDSDVLARSKEPYFTTKEPGKGTGLGLSSAYGFARQSGGAVQIYSEVGLGTTINLYLPTSPGAKTSLDMPASTAKNYDGRGRSILIVEDEKEIRSHVANVLSRGKYVVRSAENAAAAIKCLEDEGPFDLLLTDIVMPGALNGVELAQRAKEIAPEMKVLFTSGFVGAAFKDMTRANGGDYRLLQKPYRSTQLFDAVEEALSGE